MNTVLCRVVSSCPISFGKSAFAAFFVPPRVGLCRGVRELLLAVARSKSARLGPGRFAEAPNRGVSSRRSARARPPVSLPAHCSNRRFSARQYHDDQPLLAECAGSARTGADAHGSRRRIRTPFAQTGSETPTRGASKPAVETASNWLNLKGWCGRGDSNPHDLAIASPSSWCVCRSATSARRLMRLSAGPTPAEYMADVERRQPTAETPRPSIRSEDP